VEQVRAVPVYLNAGFGVFLAVGVAANMAATVHDDNAKSEVLGTLLRNGQPEKPRANDNKIRVHTLSKG
jgi:hypothetical protein